MSTSFPEKGKWLSDCLPSIGFDIDQNGNVRKVDQAEALYGTIQIAHIIKDDVFRNEITDY